MAVEVEDVVTVDWDVWNVERFVFGAGDPPTRDDAGSSVTRTARGSPDGTQGETKPRTVAAPASATTARRAWPRASPVWAERGSRIVRSRSSK